MGIPPTNKRVVTHGCTVEEVRNGKLVREWIYWDTGNLLRQIGVLPSPTTSVAAAAR
jgi:predicted ester cyclase